ncbi:hypothetical protein HJC23_011898 [Cyclotella cryptica]|uniref:Uncharacterized protein n=1 Tax=Cyclotella cryptica TaxID=29204 RepID=A0ABD3PLP6_9STRA|eukprot:CCRYP_013853-RA/>CCRYP_013853-RA protein AED:0.33 eAED:0.33 QI:0/-1/0/1/-1/1/1/0/164
MSLPSGSNVFNPVMTAMQNSGAKTVRFSDTAEIRHVSYPTAEEKQERWYYLEDVCKFKMILAHDIHRSSRMLISRSEQGVGISEDERDMCIGIEHLLSRDVKGRILALSTMRKNHLYIVLIEQARQKHFQMNSVDEMERVSTTSSHIARQRSHKIAILSMPALS